MLLFELDLPYQETTLIDALRDFLPMAVEHLGLKSLPEIHLEKALGERDQPTFACFNRAKWSIRLQAVDRHTMDILRSLAHELVHAKQHMNDELHDQSGETGSEHENEANAEAGVIMRNFAKQFPKHLSTKPISI